MYVALGRLTAHTRPFQESRSSIRGPGSVDTLRLTCSKSLVEVLSDSSRIRKVDILGAARGLKCTNVQLLYEGGSMMYPTNMIGDVIWLKSSKSPKLGWATSRIAFLFPSSSWSCLFLLHLTPPPLEKKKESRWPFQGWQTQQPEKFTVRKCSHHWVVCGWGCSVFEVTGTDNATCMLYAKFSVSFSLRFAPCC